MIHPTAIIDPRAELHPSVTVGPYAIIDGPARIGENVRIEAHAQILGPTTIGADSSIGRAAIIGGDPQDLSFKPETRSELIIGQRNTIREQVTIHRGSKDGQATRLGDDNFIMACVHFAHDVQVGNRCIVANAALFGGHVHLGNNVFIGGGSMFHQFIRVGDFAMIQGNASMSKDVPPYCVAQLLNRIAGLNIIGMRRAGFTPAERSEVKAVFDRVFRSGLNLSQAISSIENRNWSPPCQRFIEFISHRTKKGICRLRGKGTDAE